MLVNAKSDVMSTLKEGLQNKRQTKLPKRQASSGANVSSGGKPQTWVPRGDVPTLPIYKDCLGGSISVLGKRISLLEGRIDLSSIKEKIKKRLIIN